MEELIKLNYAEGREKFPVSARHLHGFFLQVKHPFTIWIRNRIKQYPFFVEGEDYIIFSEKRKNLEGKNIAGRPRVEYYLTMDMAKKLSMIESTERGEQARNYFIDMEKIAVAKSQEPKEIPEAKVLANALPDQRLEVFFKVHQYKEVYQGVRDYVSRFKDIKIKSWEIWLHNGL